MATIVTLNDIRRATQLHVNTLGVRGYAKKIKANYGHLWAFLSQDARPRPSLLRAMGYRRVQTEVYERMK